MFINVALGSMEFRENAILPGRRWAKTIDIYTWFAPYLDLFAAGQFRGGFPNA